MCPGGHLGGATTQGKDKLQLEQTALEVAGQRRGRALTRSCRGRLTSLRAHVTVVHQKHRELLRSPLSLFPPRPVFSTSFSLLELTVENIMSLRFSAQNAAINNHETESGSSQSSEDEQDLTWEDWVSDSLENRPCKSLFDQEKSFPSVTDALQHDKSVHGVDLDAICSTLCASSCLRACFGSLTPLYSTRSLPANPAHKLDTERGE